MRESERIDRILGLMGELWKLAPDMRLGQLLENYVYDRPGSLFRQDDDFTERRLLEVLEGAKRIKKAANPSIYDKMKQDIPTQRISESPLGNRLATGEYAGALRKEFKECLRKILLEIAISAHNRKSTDITGITKRALECREHYFQGMKGATNITKEAIEELMVRESERQSRFYTRLAKFEEYFKQFTGLWTRFAIHPPRVFNDRSGWGSSGWDTGLTVGCSITVGSTELLAFPLVQATAATYYDDVLFIDEDCVIVLDFLPKAVEPFQHITMWCQEFAESGAASIRSAKKDFPLAKEATIYNRFLLLDSEESLSHRQLGDMCNKYGVVAILKVDPKNHKAFIYTGQEDVPLHIRLELLH